MKLKIAKTVFFCILAINVASINLVAFADPSDDPHITPAEAAAATKTGDSGSGEALGDSHKVSDFGKNNPCVDDKNDTKFIITVIEEPLDIKEEKKADFEYRKCYRHSYTQIDDKGKASNVSALTNKKEPCSSDLAKKAQEITAAGKAAYDKDPKKLPPFVSASYFCKEVQVILSKGGTSLIYGYIGMLYRWGASMAGVIAVTVIILSGIQISAAGGDPEAVGSAKKRILKSIAGIVVLFLSGLILYTINPNFFVAGS